MTHGEPATFPNLGWVLGFCRPEQVFDVAEKILTTQRDFGDRTNRKHARLKYTILDRGVEWFKEELQRRLGWNARARAALSLRAPRRPLRLGQGHQRQVAPHALHRERPHSRLGRLSADDRPAGDRRRSHDGDLRLTANQNLIIGNVSEENRPRIDQLVQEHKLSDGERISALRRNAMACVALPTCGLAMAESERYLPALVTKLEAAACGGRACRARRS